MWPRTCAGVLAGLLFLAGIPASAAQQDNLAFVDVAQTQSAVDAANLGLAAVLSYEYRTLDQNAQIAQDRGTANYVAQRAGEMAKARNTIMRQHQTVTTKVVASGVRDLRAATARLVVFLDQTTTRGDTSRTVVTGYAAVVELRLVGGHWKLESVSSTTP